MIIIAKTSPKIIKNDIESFDGCTNLTKNFVKILWKFKYIVHKTYTCLI
jgi:uncharacterized protein YutD